VLVTKDGMSIRFHEEQLRDQGRATVGVWGIRTRQRRLCRRHRDCRSQRHAARGGRTRHRQNARRSTNTGVQNKGGKGIITMKTTDKVGSVVGALSVTDNDEIMLSTAQARPFALRAKTSVPPAATPRA